LLLTLAAALVAIACALASARRLAWAVTPTFLDAGMLSEALGSDDGGAFYPNLGEAIGTDERLRWEHDLFEAFASLDSRTKDALVNEQLLELDGRVQRWARVPRVCASIAMSAGVMFACVGLLRGLAVAAEGETGAVHGSLASALGALTIGMAGASFCIAVHVRAAQVLRERLAGTDRLVNRLEALGGGGGTSGGRAVSFSRDSPSW
jgi:hypothetical protein